MSNDHHHRGREIKAAASVARDAAEHRLSPADLEAQAVEELRSLVGTVVGPDDPAWELQVEVARQAIALGALSADELSEWAAAMRHRAGAASHGPGPHDDPGEAVSSASGATRGQSGGSEALDADADGRNPLTGTITPPLSGNSDLAGDPPLTEPEPEPEAETDTEPADGCGCDDTPTLVTLADGRRIPSHRIAARGRGVPGGGLPG